MCRRLRFVDRWWHIDNLDCSDKLRVNGECCTSRRLERRDELAIGRVRYRIDYAPPVDQKASDLLEQIAESVLLGDRAAESRTRHTPAGDRPQREPETPAVTVPAIATPASHSAEPSELLGRLVPLGGGPDHPLMKPKIMVGRQPPCDVVLRVGTISSRHCELDLIEGYWHVTDLKSRNGVRLDSVRCDQAWVFPDSRLSIADQRFRLDYTPDGEPPVPRPSLMAQAGLVGENLERLLTKQSRPGNQDADSERKRFELLEDV